MKKKESSNYSGPELGKNIDEELNDVPQKNYKNSDNPKKKTRSLRPASSKPKKQTNHPLQSTHKKGSYESSSKYIPRTGVHDKEMSDVSLRQTIVALRSENTKLRSRVKQSERELVQKNQEMRKFLTQTNVPTYTGTRKGGLAVDKITKKVALIERENKALKIKLENIKKSLKMTTAQELAAEVKTYSDECARLRAMLSKDSEGKLYEETKKSSGGDIEKLKLENKELTEKLQKTTDELNKLKAKAEDKNSLKTVNENLTKEIGKLKAQVEDLKAADKSKPKMEELKKTKDEFAKQARDYERRIKDLEDKLVESRKANIGEEIKEIKKEQKKPEGKKVKIVSDEEAKLLATEIRLNLVLAKIECKDLKKILFKDLSNDKKVKIQECADALRQSPISLNADNATKLARYVIEPRTSKELPYNESLDKKVSAMREEISALIGSYTLNYFNNPETIQESLLEKLNEKLEAFADTLQESADSDGNLAVKVLEKTCSDMKLDLSQEEIDYILLVMYENSKDMNKLKYETFVEHLGRLLNKFLEQENSPQVNKEKGSEKGSETKKSEKSSGKMSDGNENLSEDEVLALVQKCFTMIAEKIAEKKIPIKAVFKDEIYKKNIEGQEMELISPNGFMKCIKNIGVKELSPLEQTYLNKMLAANDSDDGFKVADIIQIFEDYGIQEKGSGEEKEMGIEDLDKVSMVLLLALSEYIANANSDLNKVFGKAIYKQPVQIDDEELEIEIIDSHDFFETINSIGIETEESQHENLKAFLAIDASYLDKFSVDKLKMTLEEFKTNEELRNNARNFYQELVDEDQVEEDDINNHEPEAEEDDLRKSGHGHGNNSF